MDVPFLPPTDELRAVIETLSGPRGPLAGLVIALDREENPLASSYPAEIVRCRCADGTELQFLIKYMVTLSEGHRDHGMRGGLAYEAGIYQQFLAPRVRPNFYGSCTTRGGVDLLILEFLPDCDRLDYAEDDGTLLRVAAWLGRLHASMEPVVAAGKASGVREYDSEFFLGWARRTDAFAGDWHQRAPWLAELCARFGSVADVLLSATPTLVHGEFYPHNILFRGTEIFAVDWESAATGAGELDLVCLTEGWPPEFEQACDDEYQKARWPEGAPGRFASRAAAARVYMRIRWLGEHPAWTRHEDADSELNGLRCLVRRLDELR